MTSADMNMRVRQVPPGVLNAIRFGLNGFLIGGRLKKENFYELCRR